MTFRKPEELKMSVQDQPGLKRTETGGLSSLNSSMYDQVQQSMAARRKNRQLTESQRMQSEYLKRPRGLPFTKKFLHKRNHSGANSINNTIDQKVDESMQKAGNADQ